jgi:hypothetical protein
MRVNSTCRFRKAGNGNLAGSNPEDRKTKLELAGERTSGRRIRSGRIDVQGMYWGGNTERETYKNSMHVSFGSTVDVG